jgi:hypothetical protein
MSGLQFLHLLLKKGIYMPTINTIFLLRQLISTFISFIGASFAAARMGDTAPFSFSGLIKLVSPYLTLWSC